VITSISLNDTFAHGVAIQGDGKILVASNYGVVRYQSNGTLDSTFGAGGVVSSVAGNALALESDGRIVVAGPGYGGPGNTGATFFLARLNVNGSLDTSFGKKGTVNTDFQRGDDFAYSVVIQSDGKIVEGGSATIAKNAQFALARYLADGTLESSFGIGG